MTRPTRLSAALALAICLTTIAPAQAQLSFGFGFKYNDENENFIVPSLCILTNRGLRNAIEKAGYVDVYLNAPVGEQVQARARDGEWIYLLRVNACTGDVIEREQLRRAQGGSAGGNLTERG